MFLLIWMSLQQQFSFVQYLFVNINQLQKHWHWKRLMLALLLEEAHIGKMVLENVVLLLLNWTNRENVWHWLWVNLIKAFQFFLIAFHRPESLPTALLLEGSCTSCGWFGTIQFLSKHFREEVGEWAMFSSALLNAFYRDRSHITYLAIWQNRENVWYWLS